MLADDAMRVYIRFIHAIIVHVLGDKHATALSAAICGALVFAR